MLKYTLNRLEETKIVRQTNERRETDKKLKHFKISETKKKR
jgi:hypothetical protein